MPIDDNLYLAVMGPRSLLRDKSDVERVLKFVGELERRSGATMAPALQLQLAVVCTSAKMYERATPLFEVAVRSDICGGGGRAAGRGACSCFACLSHLTIVHTSLSRRSNVPKPSRDTYNSLALIPWYVVSMYFIGVFCQSYPLPVSPPVATILEGGEAHVTHARSRMAIDTRTPTTS